MKVQVRSGPQLEAGAGSLLVLPFFVGGECATGALLTKCDEIVTLGRLAPTVERRRITGKPGELVSLDTSSGGQVLLVGIGKADEFGPVAQREFAARAIAHARDQRIGRVQVVLPDGPWPAQLLAEQVALGADLGLYEYRTHKSEDPERPAFEVEELVVVPPEALEVELPNHVSGIAAGINSARELTNLPPNECTPEFLAEHARSLCSGSARRLEVIDIFSFGEIERYGMGGLAAVGRGAEHGPRFIHFRYVPPEGGALKTPIKVFFVGKGLCHDSGGLSIKRAGSQAEMFIDKGGAAAVFGAAQAIAALRPLDVEVHFIVGAAINAVSAQAYRPSDILRLACGLTVEVSNTDAEGRLVLADCLHRAVKLKPTLIVDLATLTGASMVGFGENVAALWTNDQVGFDGRVAPVQSAILTAACAAGEPLWPLPPDRSLAELLKSHRADMINAVMSAPYGGAITAALFLERCVAKSANGSSGKGDRAKVPWAHIDLAGPAHRARPKAPWPAGGTGFGVLTLVELVKMAERGQLNLS